MTSDKKLKDNTVEKIIDKILKHYYCQISKRKFKNALYRVRRIEYLNKIIDFEPTEQYIDSVCDKYYKESPEEKLLKALGIDFNNYFDKEIKELNADSVEEDLLHLRLIKAFKTKLDDFPNNEYIKKM